MVFLGLVLGFIFVTAPTYAAVSQTSTPPAQLAGRVVDEATGTPISSARVILFAQMPNAQGPIQTFTDQDGRYTFAGVAPGRYRVDVQKSGIIPRADPPRAPTVTLAAGQVVDDWDVPVQRGGAIAGRILDPSGEPLVDVSVRAERRNGPAAGSSQAIVNNSVSVELRAQGFQGLRPQAFQTNDLGEFRIFGLAPGEYVLSASPQQRFGFQNVSSDATLLASTFYPGVPDSAAAQPIAVTAGETVGGVEFRLLTTAGFRVSGVVVDQAGAPVAGAMVMLRGDPRSGVAIIGPTGQSSTDANGMFVLGNVPSGSYFATVIPLFTSRAIQSNGVESVAINGQLRAVGADPIAVVVADADVDGLTIVVSRTPE
jgi:hypothetical protein